MNLRFQSVEARSQFMTILLCLVPVAATCFTWMHLYDAHWKTISEQEAADIAQRAVVAHVNGLRAEGFNIRPVDGWRLTGTNAQPPAWRVVLRAIGSTSQVNFVEVTFSSGSNGWTIDVPVIYRNGPQN